MAVGLRRLVAVKFVHKCIPDKKSQEKTGKCGGAGGSGMVSDRAYNIWSFFSLQLRRRSVLPFK